MKNLTCCNHNNLGVFQKIHLAESHALFESPENPVLSLDDRLALETIAATWSSLMPEVKVTILKIIEVTRKESLAER